MEQVKTPAGWYPNPYGQQQWWDGTQWGQLAAPQPVATPPQTPVIVNQRKNYKTSHSFHLIMSLVTLGLWLPVWLIVGIYNAAKA